MHIFHEKLPEFLEQVQKLRAMHREIQEAEWKLERNRKGLYSDNLRIEEGKIKTAKEKLNERKNLIAPALRKHYEEARQRFLDEEAELGRAWVSLNENMKRAVAEMEKDPTNFTNVEGFLTHAIYWIKKILKLTGQLKTEAAAL